MPSTRRNLVITGTAAVAAIAVVVIGVVISPHHEPTPSLSVATSANATPTAMPYAAPSRSAIAALPEARYNTVIPGLLAFRATSVPAAMNAVNTLTADAPIYGDDRAKPVARLAAKNFLKQDTVVVPVRVDGPWALVLTPARRSLPSADNSAPAQTAAWIRTDLLHKAQQLVDHIVVNVRAQTVSIVDRSGKTKKTFTAGVGANGTPTPTGVGYMEARYLDPAQDQTVYPIGLTSLHSSAADEPFGGSDGGLIGIHYQPDHSGAVSHGCVRLDGPSITALNQLPLGTPIVMNP